jgi:hypothetical protein
MLDVLEEKKFASLWKPLGSAEWCQRQTMLACNRVFRTWWCVSFLWLDVPLQPFLWLTRVKSRSDSPTSPGQTLVIALDSHYPPKWWRLHPQPTDQFLKLSSSAPPAYNTHNFLNHIIPWMNEINILPRDIANRRMRMKYDTFEGGWVRQNTTVVGSYLLVWRWLHISAVLGHL